MDTKDIEFIRLARERYEESETADADNRKLALDDIRCLDGSGQWPDKIRAEREQDGRPCLTINRLPGFVDQVVGDQRQNRPRIKVRPVDDKSDPETADIIEGLIRNIEYTSHADSSYDTAFENAANHGFGYFRILKDYAGKDTFDQDILIKRIKNSFSVRFDPNAQEADKSDAEWCFVEEVIRKKEFERRFPKASWPSDWESSSAGNAYQGWFMTDKVRIAEYWTRTPVEKVIVQLENGLVMAKDDATPERLMEFAITDPATGVVVVPKVIKERISKSYEVQQYIISGNEILEGPKKWDSEYIPIIPVLGKELVVDGKSILRGVIRNAKDSQRMFNYWKHLAIDTPIPTPTGWTTMGKVNVGDKVFDENGLPCQVIGKSPVQIHHDCYRVLFDDGSGITASDSHVWQVEERGKRKTAGWEWTTKKVATSELTPRKHFIWATRPLDCLSADLPIHPYLLGLWLGDGNASGPVICPGDEDIDEVRDKLISLGYSLSKVRASNHHGIFTVLGVMGEFKKLNLIGNKHVPASYLRSSIQQRWSLLQGFMDSDGSIGKRTKVCDYTTTNPLIATGFSELLRSLGIKAVSLRREGRRSGLVGGDSIVQEVIQFSFSCYVNEPVFGLKRKVILQGKAKEHRRRTKRHRIVSVKRIPSVPVQCIGIDAPSHMFLAGEAMIPTHNSVSTETIALAPKAPFMATPEQIEGHETLWSASHRKSIPYLLYNHTGAPMPQRQFPATIPQGAFTEAQAAVDDMKATTGIYDASLGAKSNETSGKAIMARQKEGDVATFVFIDNLSRAIQHAGRILVEMIPKVYDTERIVRIMNIDGTNKSIPINKSGMDESGLPVILNDITVGKYDVVVEAGPSYTTQRQEAAESILGFMQATPTQAPLMSDLAAKNMDWPDAQEIAARLKKTLPPGLAEPDENEPPPEPQPNPQAELEGQKMQLEQAKLQMEEQKMRQEMAIEQQKMQLEQQKMQMEFQKLQAEMELERENMALERFKIEMEVEKARDAGVGGD